MVYRLKCDCDERVGITIETMKDFKELKLFFEQQINRGIFVEEKQKEPYRVWTDGITVKKNVATKWYRCKVCGCLWEFQYPDFPARGFVKKYIGGNYTGTEYIRV